MKKAKTLSKKIEDKYVDFSTHSKILWLRGVLQSVDVEFNSSVGVKISVGQFLERFLFTKADIIVDQRTDEALKGFNKKLKKIKINHELLEKNVEEYTKIFLRFIGMIGSQSYEELREAYINQMVHFYDVKYSIETNKLFYQQLLSRLTIDHLYLLKFSEEYLGEDIATGSQKSRTLNDAILQEFVVVKKLEKPLVNGLIKDLDSMGLLNQWQSSALGGDIHYLSLTELGIKLLEQVETHF